jgi:hypothetical protein
MRLWFNQVYAIWPLIAGISYLIVACAVVEWWIVRLRRLSDHQLKLADFAWICTSAIQLAFLLLSAREAALKERIDAAEGQSATIHEFYTNKMRVGTDECLNGGWPAGAVKGKSYRENGDMVTEACRGVSSMLNYIGQLFDDTQLWRYPPSVETAVAWEKRYQDVFVRDFDHELMYGFISPQPRPIDALTQEAKSEFEAYGQKLVALKHEAGQAAFEKAFVHKLGRIGLFWPVVVATSVAFSFGKARIAMREVKHVHQTAHETLKEPEDLESTFE